MRTRLRQTGSDRRTTASIREAADVSVQRVLDLLAGVQVTAFDEEPDDDARPAACLPACDERASGEDPRDVQQHECGIEHSREQFVSTFLEGPAKKSREPLLVALQRACIADIAVTSSHCPCNIESLLVG